MRFGDLAAVLCIRCDVSSLYMVGIFPLTVPRGEITFSKKFGFLETGTDIAGIMADIDWRLEYLAVVGYTNIGSEHSD